MEFKTKLAIFLMVFVVVGMGCVVYLENKQEEVVNVGNFQIDKKNLDHISNIFDSDQGIPICNLDTYECVVIQTRG